MKSLSVIRGDGPHTLMSALEIIAKTLRNLRGGCMFLGKATGSDPRGEPGLQQTSLVFGQVVSTAWGQLGSGGGQAQQSIGQEDRRCVEITQVRLQCWRLRSSDFPVWVETTETVIIVVTQWALPLHEDCPTGPTGTLHAGR